MLRKNFVKIKTYTLKIAYFQTPKAKNIYFQSKIPSMNFKTK